MRNLTVEMARPLTQMTPREEQPAVAQKVAFLQNSSVYPHAPLQVEVIETHMAWVFLAGELAYKMKKPVRYEFLDFTTLNGREFTCREEVRLNARLAPTVYLGVVPLRLDQKGKLTFEGDGPIVEWLVKMRRLPAGRMLDHLIEHGTVSEEEIRAVGEKLTAFYCTAPPVAQSLDDIWQRIAAEHERNVRLLSDRQFALNHALTASVLQRMAAALIVARPLLAKRLDAGVYIEGHGDLRPEHVCLVSPPVVIDCLEFNRDLRIVDPFDEIAFLDLECERLGGAWIGQRILDFCLRELPPAPPPGLLAFYRGTRALLRARLALAHLTEQHPRMPEKWEPRARFYVALTDTALTRFAASMAQ